MLLKDELT